MKILKTIASATGSAETEMDSNKTIEGERFSGSNGYDPSCTRSHKRLKAAEELGLNPRQAWVVALIAEGLSNKEMAKCMGTTEYAVKEQVSAVLRRLGVRSRVQVILHLDQRSMESRQSVTPEELGLTPRHGSVLVLILEGLSNESIALRLGLATSTVKEYVSEILRRLNLRTRAQVISRLKHLGIRLPPELVSCYGRHIRPWPSFV